MCDKNSTINCLKSFRFTKCKLGSRSQVLAVSQILREKYHNLKPKKVPVTTMWTLEKFLEHLQTV
jgi:hypothetical protein